MLDTRPDASGSFGRGLGAQRGAALAATDCLIDGSYEVAVFARDSVRVELSDTVIRDTRLGWSSQAALGITAEGGANVTATRVSVQDTEGVGLYVVDDDSVLACDSCTIERSQFAGAVLLEGTLELRQSTVRETAASAIQGGGVGVYAGQDRSAGTARALLLEDTDVTSHPYAGIWLAEPGDYVIDGGSLEGGDGVDVGGPLVHGNAVYAHESAIAVATGWSWTSNSPSISTTPCRLSEPRGEPRACGRSAGGETGAPGWRRAARARVRGMNRSEGDVPHLGRIG